jgi:diguanylate cyclase (GGDEF)-like protein
MSSSSAKLGVVTQPEVSPALVQFQHEDDVRQRRLDLINALQSTLELQEQLNIFHRWLGQLVAVDGLKYLNPQHQIELILGAETLHHCHYRLSTEQESLGEIEFTRRQRFSEEELSQIETSLTALLYPVRNALRYHVAVQTALRDPLTGAGNRIALDNALHRECQLAERYAQSVSLLVLDIDHFKAINDSHGHSVGDQVLQQVADCIRTVTRETDMTFRYGGEEFVVVLSKTDLPGAALIAERVRHSIAQQTFATQAGNIHLTVSLGASSLGVKENIKNLFDRADQALYQAKSLGRNRVICKP